MEANDPVKHMLIHDAEQALHLIAEAGAPHPEHAGASTTSELQEACDRYVDADAANWYEVRREQGDEPAEAARQTLDKMRERLISTAKHPTRSTDPFGSLHWTEHVAALARLVSGDTQGSHYLRTILRHEGDSGGD